MTLKREFTELLKGCTPVKDSDGNIIVQSIMNMQVVCLTTDDEFSLDDRFANPMENVFASNRNYGQISFTNENEKEVIMPAQVAVMTKQRAQNHGMIKAGYLPAYSEKTYNDAGCVQGSQTGHFSNTNEYRIIPVAMREMLFDKINKEGGFDRIYSAINHLGSQTQSRTNNYLDVYFNQYDKKLEEFIAHFERPNKFIGVVIFIDGEIVAIDKFPSFTYAEQVWDVMIRDCYGALAVISELKDKKSRKVFGDVFSEVKSKSIGVSIAELLETSLKQTKKQITDSVRGKIEDFLDVEFDAELDHNGNNGSEKCKSYVLKSEGYVGQVISESGLNHLVSIVKRDSFDPNALRRVNELRKKARKQNKFTL